MSRERSSVDLTAAIVMAGALACESDRIARTPSICDGLEPSASQTCTATDEDGIVITGWCCWAVPPKWRHGRCAAPGAAACDGMRLGPCVGAMRPSVELCDGRGIDEDCDGETDEEDPEEGEECSGSLFGRGAKRCVSGRLTCWPAIERETCDGRDNDWNGVVDDVMPEVFYDGPIATLANPPCRPGVRACRAGKMVTIVEPIYPRPETCGDGIDNDCNGVVDDSPRLPLDVWFVVDTSCSMGPRVGVVAQEIKAAAAWMAPGSRVGLMASPNPLEDGHLAIWLPLGPPELLTESLDLLLAAPQSGSDEPTLLALWIACASEWRAQRRIVMAFADEPPDGPANAQMPPPEAIDLACRAAGVFVHVWSDFPQAYVPLDASPLVAYHDETWSVAPKPLDLLARAVCP